MKIIPQWQLHRLQFICVVFACGIWLASGCDVAFGPTCGNNRYIYGSHLYSIELDGHSEWVLNTAIDMDASAFEHIAHEESSSFIYISHNGGVTLLSLGPETPKRKTYWIDGGRGFLLAPDNRQFLYKTNRDDAYLGIMDTSGNFVTKVPMPTTTHIVEHPMWVDSSHIAFFVHDSTLGNGIYLSNIHGGDFRKLYSTYDCRGFDLSSDAEILIVSEAQTDERGNNLAINRINLDTGEKRELIWGGLEPKFVGGEQSILYRTGIYLSLLLQDGTRLDPLIQIYDSDLPYDMTEDGDKLVAVTRENGTYNLTFVDLRNGHRNRLGVVSQFETTFDPHHWDGVRSQLQAPFFSVDGNTAYVFARREYYDDGCPNP